MTTMRLGDVSLENVFLARMVRVSTALWQPEIFVERPSASQAASRSPFLNSLFAVWVHSCTRFLSIGPTQPINQYFITTLCSWVLYSRMCSVQSLGYASAFLVSTTIYIYESSNHK